MELEELKNMWSEYDKKLDKNLRLNMQLLRQMKLDKAGFQVKTLFVIKALEMCFLVIIIGWLTSFALQFISSLRFCVPAFILAGLFVILFIAVIFQVSMTTQLQLKSNAEAIAPLQKKAENLKYLIVNYLKYFLFLTPLIYLLTFIVIAKAFLNIDYFQPQHRAYVISNVIVAIAFLPLCIWLFKELNKKVIEKKWVKKLLTGSGWYQAQAAQEFCKEIEEFEKE